MGIVLAKEICIKAMDTIRNKREPFIHDKKSNKILALTLSIMLGTSTLLNSGLVYADNIDTTKKEMPKKIENEIIGKITSISATSLTAKTVRDARFGGPRGMKPNGEPQKQQQQ